jgi:argonaute-like protein implicated in RNA metabolism and viral defense
MDWRDANTSSMEDGVKNATEKIVIIDGYKGGDLEKSKFVNWLFGVVRSTNFTTFLILLRFTAVCVSIREQMTGVLSLPAEGVKANRDRSIFGMTVTMDKMPDLYALVINNILQDKCLNTGYVAMKARSMYVVTGR